MAIYHCSRVNIRARVHKHGRHANNPWCDESTIANGRTTGNDANVFFDRRRPDWIRIFVEESETITARNVSDRAHAKPEQQSLLHPGIDEPLTVRSLFRSP